MRRLTTNLRTHWHTIRHADDGATLVFAAVILVAILALSAFAIDFGRMWEERRQLQNGADAAALAIAEDCARGLCNASYDEYATAEIYVDDNARDGLAWAQQVDLDLTNQTVTVYNATEDPGGDNKFDMLLAGIVGFDGFTVTAQATAVWGYSNDIATIPLIISACEWAKSFPDGPGGIEPADEDDPWLPPTQLFDEPTLSGSNIKVPWTASNNIPSWLSGYSPPTSYPPPVTLTFHDAAVTDDCAAQAGQDTDGNDRLPGGFGWLQQDECIAHIEQDIWVGAKPGSGAPQDCDPDDLLDKILMIPIFNDVTEPGGGGFAGQCTTGPGGKCYRIDGFAAFYVTGFRFPGGQGWRQNPPCNPPDTCISGYFTDYVLPGSTGGGDNDFGAQTVWLIA